jgi:hypothetical protein
MSTAQPSNLLVQKEFAIRRDGLVYKIKVSAAFLSAGFVTGEVGSYTVSFDSSRGDLLQWTQPDQRSYSRAEAKEAAEELFSSGQVQRYIEANLQTWIHLGALNPDSVDR